VTREYRDVASSKGMPTSTVYPTRFETINRSAHTHSAQRKYVFMQGRQWKLAYDGIWVMFLPRSSIL